MEASIIFGGVIVSLIVQYLKTKYGTKEWTTLLLSVLLSIVGAVGYVILLHTGLWGEAVKIFIMASAFYAVIVKRFQS